MNVWTPAAPTRKSPTDVGAWSGMITNDELGLTYWFVPIFQLITVGLVVLGVWLHRWWAARRAEPKR